MTLRARSQVLLNRWSYAGALPEGGFSVPYRATYSVFCSCTHRQACVATNVDTSAHILVSQGGQTDVCAQEWTYTVTGVK